MAPRTPGSNRPRNLHKRIRLSTSHSIHSALHGMREALVVERQPGPFLTSPLQPDNAMANKKGQKAGTQRGNRQRFPCDPVPSFAQDNNGLAANRVIFGCKKINRLALKSKPKKLPHPRPAPHDRADRNRATPLACA